MPRRHLEAHASASPDTPSALPPDGPEGGSSRGSERGASSRVHPLGPIQQPALSIVGIDGAVTGGQTTSYTVTASPATQGDRSVALSTDHPEVFTSMPSSVTIASQSTSVTFQVGTNAVSANVVATVTARCTGLVASTTTEVTP